VSTWGSPGGCQAGDKSPSQSGRIYRHRHTELQQQAQKRLPKRLPNATHERRGSISCESEAKTKATQATLAVPSTMTRAYSFPRTSDRHSVRVSFRIHNSLSPVGAKRWGCCGAVELVVALRNTGLGASRRRRRIRIGNDVCGTTRCYRVICDG